MMHQFILKKALAISLAILTLTIAVQSHDMTKAIESTATIADLEARKQENNRKIQEYENQLKGFAENQKQAAAYQATLQNKIDTLQNNMQIMDTELENLKKNIYLLNLDITNLELEISDQEIRIEKGLEDFKLRLRAMYINGNDSLISALVGATDFYDLLSKYELISCIARHDDALVTNLKTELEAYHANLDTLEMQKQEQEQAQAEKQALQKEMKDSMNDLRFAYADSQAEQERLAAEQDAADKNINQLKADNQLADQAEAEIREQIRRAEEARKKETTVTTVKTTISTTVTTKAAVTSAETTYTSKITTASEISSQTTAETQPDLSTAPETIPTDAITSLITTTTTTTTTTEPAPPETAPEMPATQPPTEIPQVTDDYDASAFGWPCPGYYYISSGFGTRWGTTHKGIDIAQNAGADAVASRAGKVIKINTSCTHNYGKSKNCCGNGYGNYVLIDHEDGTYSTMYAHLQTVLVSVGDYVEKGQTVGYVGTTGWSTGYHLHFEIRKNGTAVNPSNYLNY